MDRRTHHVLDGADAGEIDDGNDLAGDVRKAVAGTLEHFGRALDLAGKGGGEEVLDGLPAFWGLQIAAGRNLAVMVNRKSMARIVELGAQAGQPFIPHQHQEMGLRQPFWLGRVKTGGAVFDRVAAVGQKRLTGAKLGAGKLLGGQALDGVAIDPGDPGRLGCGRHAAY